MAGSSFRDLVSCSLLASTLAGCNVGGTWKPPPPLPIEQNPPYSLSASEMTAIEDSLRDRMKDPSSTQFRHVQAVTKKDGTIQVCGEVNSKNSFGGYNGFAPFTGYLSGQTFKINIMPAQSSDIQAFAYSSCRTAGMSL